MGNVIPWNGITRLDTDPAGVIASAAQADLTGVIILGFDSEGAEYFASSYADGGEVVWHLERAKFKLMQIAQDAGSD